MKALIIDDEPAIREALAQTLKSARIDSAVAADGEDGLAQLGARDDIGVVFLDIKMPGLDGMEVLCRIREHWPRMPVVMISGHGTIETAVDATKRGAFDFLEKPLDRDRILLVARNGLDHATLQRENQNLKAREATRILGKSAAVKELLRDIDRVAPSHARVLITGENGSGKELVARRLHDLSPRSGGAFIDVNCAAIPRDLLESELFGHEKGSFTGAHAQKKGKFELADGGTLFLDEIGDMDPAAQAKVLRVLEENKIERVGGDHPIRVDVRVLAATNKDLLSEVKEGRFREDLYYRLAVVELRSPALRARREDVPLLGGHFLADSIRRNGLEARELTADACDELARQDWPGNVRQLKNVMERAAILVPKREIDASDVRKVMGGPAAVPTEDPYRDARSFEEFKDRAEEEFIEKRLIENNWNVKRTAELLGMQRSNLYKKIEKYDLKKPQ